MKLLTVALQALAASRKPCNKISTWDRKNPPATRHQFQFWDAKN